MKNYKSIIFALLGIITFNFYVTQANNNTFWQRFTRAIWGTNNKNSLTQLQKNYIQKIRNELNNIPTIDRQAIVIELEDRFIKEQPQTENACQQVRNRAILDHFKAILTAIFFEFPFSLKEKIAIQRSLVDNVQAYLSQNNSLDSPRFSQFFERNSLAELIQQARQSLYTSGNQSYNPTPSAPSEYQQPTYSHPGQKPAPVQPSAPSAYHSSYDDFLRQVRHDLKGIPESDINAIIATGRQELLRKTPTNDYNKNSIMREIITNRVRINTRTIASQFTNNATLIDNTVQSMSGNVKARLARGDNLNGQALQQFFGSNLEHLVKQNINTHSTGDNNSPLTLPKEYAPSAPPTSTQETIECCICLEDFEKATLKNIPCKNFHTDKICSTCVSELTTCPLCRENLK